MPRRRRCAHRPLPGRSRACGHLAVLGEITPADADRVLAPSGSRLRRSSRVHRRTGRDCSDSTMRAPPGPAVPLGVHVPATGHDVASTSTRRRRGEERPATTTTSTAENCGQRGPRLPTCTSTTPQTPPRAAPTSCRSHQVSPSSTSTTKAAPTKRAVETVSTVASVNLAALVDADVLELQRRHGHREADQHLCPHPGPSRLRESSSKIAAHTTGRRTKIIVATLIGP